MIFIHLKREVCKRNLVWGSLDEWWDAVVASTNFLIADRELIVAAIVFTVLFGDASMDWRGNSQTSCH
jgi:hypothetical protein